jgi:cytochrome c oxidase subunit III
MNVTPAMDVSHLDLEEFGRSDTLWWGVMGLLVIEGTAFALLIAGYFFYRMRYTEWPPTDAGLPQWSFSVANLILMLLITYPMWKIAKKAPTADRRWLSKMLGVTAVLIGVSTVLRYFEFRNLQTDWNEHSYGSIVWALLFMHGFHLATTAGETAMLAVYAAVKNLDRKHRADIQVNTLYWYFVVVSWIVIFSVVYLAARIL